MAKCFNTAGPCIPEWFALQKDGTRDMSNVGERPTFCLSNRELAEEAVRDL